MLCNSSCNKVLFTTTSSSDHDIWKVFKSLNNLEVIHFETNISKIPTEAFDSKKLSEMCISTTHNWKHKITMRRNAFYNLNNLKVIILHIDIDTIEIEAFA